MNTGIKIIGCAFALAMSQATLHSDGTVSASSVATRGGRVGWARMITPDYQWNIHDNQDPKLARFIQRQTSLNIGPVWNSVSPEDLEGLCSYPFVYVKDLLRVSGPLALRNIQEYLRRGGFLCVDPCTAHMSSEDAQTFLHMHADWFARLIPGCVVRELPDNHPLYRCYFTVGVDDLFTPDMINLGAVKPSHIGMWGVFQGDRMIAVLSISGLECGWPQTPERVLGCMKMIVNIYVFAMTRAVDAASRHP
jgi:hypothetical protein